MTEQTAPSPVKFNFRYQFYWGVAALGLSLISGVYGGLLTIFYQDYLGLAARWIGIAATAYAIWNALNDPLFGYITDNTRSKRGRRIPYMRFTAPFLALTFVLVWFAPPQAGQQGLFEGLPGWDGGRGQTIRYIDWNDVGANTFTIANQFRVDCPPGHDVGKGFIIPDLVRPKTAGTSLIPLYVAMILVGIVGMLLILVTTFKVKERREFATVDEPIPPLDAIKLTFTSRAFLFLVAGNFMNILMSSLLMGAIFYLADYVLQWPAIQLLAFLFIPILIGIPITTFIRKWLGVVGAQQALLVVAGVSLLAVGFVPKHLIPLFIALAGFGLAGPQTLQNILFAQVADEDELRSGSRREGAFFGVNALITKPAQSVALWLTAFILERTNFITRAANFGEIFLDQGPEAIFGIKAFSGIIPGVACLLSALLLIWYPLRGDYLEEIKEKILVLHAEKKKHFDEQFT